MMKVFRTAVLASVFTLTGPQILAQHSDAGDHSGHGHSQSSKSMMTPMPAADLPEGTFYEIESDHVLGNADAPVTMIVYASVMCGHCASWFENDYPTIKSDYIDTGKVRLVFREFPTSPVNVAVAGFLLADCGPEDSYMDAIVYQMANQTQTKESMQAGQIQETLESLGAQAGLSPKQTGACLRDEANYAALNAVVALGRAAGVRSVPTLMINGELYPSSDASAAALSTAIDAAIGG